MVFYTHRFSGVPKEVFQTQSAIWRSSRTEDFHTILKRPSMSLLSKGDLLELFQTQIFIDFL